MFRQDSTYLLWTLATVSRGRAEALFYSKSNSCNSPSRFYMMILLVNVHLHVLKVMFVLANRILVNIELVIVIANKLGIVNQI